MDPQLVITGLGGALVSLAGVLYKELLNRASRAEDREEKASQGLKDMMPVVTSLAEVVKGQTGEITKVQGQLNDVVQMLEDLRPRSSRPKAN